MSYGVSSLGIKDFGFEHIQSRAARYFLGVHPKTPIPALYGELGWIPFKYKRWLHMCRTWNRFLAMEDDRINKQIFIQDYTSNVPNWCKDFQYVCTSLEFNDAFENLRTIDMDLFGRKLEDFAAEKWKLSLLSKPKLRTYKLFKTDLVPESYVNCCMSRFKRSIFAKFRCGILPLQLEVGRFRGQTVEQRVCPLCKTDVESEIHFLFECPVYDRNQFLYETNLSNVQSNEEKIKRCMSVHQKLTAKFITQIWNERQTLIVT